MKLTPTQRAQVRRITLLSTQLAGERRGLVDERARLLDELNALLIPLNRLRAQMPRYGSTYIGHEQPEIEKTAAQCEHERLTSEADEVKKSIAELDARIAAMVQDCNLAAFVAERLVAFSGTEALTGRDKVSGAMGAGDVRVHVSS